MEKFWVFIGNGTAIKSVVFSSAFASTFDTNEANEIVNQLNADETRVWKYKVVPLY